MAATDRQQRHVVIQRLPRQEQLHAVAVGVNVKDKVGVGAVIMLAGNVAAAGQQQAIEPSQQRAQRLLI